MQTLLRTLEPCLMFFVILSVYFCMGIGTLVTLFSLLVRFSVYFVQPYRRQDLVFLNLIPLRTCGVRLIIIGFITQRSKTILMKRG